MGKHAEWRKLAKKMRRKRIRSMLAIARDNKLREEQLEREKSPTYQAWLEEQEALEEFREAEERRLAMHRQQVWQAEEEAALLRWREQQSRLAHAKAEKFKKEILIKEEWAREQRKMEEAEEMKKKMEEDKKRKEAELLAQIDAFIDGKADLPDEVNVSTQTQPGQPDCPFFSKTGACRFRDSCSRNHTRPGISRTLLIPNFYDHASLQTLNQEEYDTDLSLEYEDSETYQHFKEFYTDVLPEFEQLGKVIQFRVCNNEEPHLRGNVYVEYLSRRHALKGYRTFQGRFYAGRRLNVEFATIPSWKNAICGLFHKQKCPKGKTCNFLHVFRNPDNAFKIYNSSSRRQFSKSRSRSPRRRSRSKEWNWSDQSGSDGESKRGRKRSRSNSRSRKSSRKRDVETNGRRSRSRSRSKNVKRRESSRERRKQRDRKHKSRSRSPKHRSKHSKQESSSKRSKNDESRNGKDASSKSHRSDKKSSSKSDKTDSERKSKNSDKTDSERKSKNSDKADSERKTKNSDKTDSERKSKRDEGLDKKSKKSDSDKVNGN